MPDRNGRSEALSNLSTRIIQVDSLDIEQPSLRARLRRRVRSFIQRPATEAVVVFLILLSVALTVWTTAFQLEAELGRFVMAVEDIITGLFIVELLIRYWVEPSRRDFFRNYWVDILAVLPILRMFRILRVLRLLRILRLFRAGVMLSRRMSAASDLFRQGLAHYFLMSLMVFLVVLFGALALIHFERPPAQSQTLMRASAALGGAAPSVIADEHEHFEELSFENAVWWAVMTVVASEPIDYSAKTRGGKVVSLIVMLSGLTLFAVITGVVSAFMVERLRVGLDNQVIYPEDLNNHFVVLGWNNRAPMIIEEIQATPRHRRTPIVVLADCPRPDNEQWRSVDRSLVYFVRGDPVNPSYLDLVQVGHAFSVVILSDISEGRSAVDRDARTVLCALMVEKLYRGSFTCAELINEQYAEHLSLAAVEEVVIADESAAAVLAMAALHLDMTKILSELLSFKAGNQFYKVTVPKAWSGASIRQCLHQLESEHQVLLVGLAPPEGFDGRGRSPDYGPNGILLNPPSDLRVRATEQFVVIGREFPKLGEKTPTFEVEHGTLGNVDSESAPRRRARELAEQRRSAPPSHPVAELSVLPEDLSGHIILLGWNRRAPMVIEEIQATPAHCERKIVVLAARSVPSAASWHGVDGRSVHWVHGDPVAPTDLERIHVSEAFSVVILSDASKKRHDSDRDARTVLAALIVEKLHRGIFTCAELIDPQHAHHLRIVGVEEIVNANHSAASVLAMATLHLNMTRILEELLSSKAGNQFYKVEIPPSWDGLRFVDCLRRINDEHDAICIGVCPPEGIPRRQLQLRGSRSTISLNPASEVIVKTGEQLLVIAREAIELRPLS